MPTRLTPNLTIDDDEIEWTYTTSRGKGGQHANRSLTRVQLTWRIDESTSLTEANQRKLMAALGPLVRIDVDEHRSQSRNREVALERLRERVTRAMQPVKKRRATKPSRASQRRRVEAKRRRSQTKSMRKKPNWD